MRYRALWKKEFWFDLVRTGLGCSVLVYSSFLRKEACAYIPLGLYMHLYWIYMNLYSYLHFQSRQASTLHRSCYRHCLCPSVVHMLPHYNALLHIYLWVSLNLDYTGALQSPRQESLRIFPPQAAASVCALLLCFLILCCFISCMFLSILTTLALSATGVVTDISPSGRFVSVCCSYASS